MGDMGDMGGIGWRGAVTGGQVRRATEGGGMGMEETGVDGMDGMGGMGMDGVGVDGMSLDDSGRHEDQPVGRMGEFRLIEQLAARFAMTPDVLIGPGDDAAVLSSGGRVVASTDLLIEGAHFRTDWSSALDVGVKAAAQNIADIVAMGARPTALLVALGLPPDLPASWPLGLADGLRLECARAGTTVAGGDLSRSERIVVAVTALGEITGAEPVLRSGARVGDVVAVTGALGASAAGLVLLQAGRDAPKEAIAAHLRPQPDYAAAARAVGRATALIDVSDGLLADAGHVARASRVTLDLNSALIPVADAAAAAARVLSVDPLAWALTGGEDHVFLATFATGDLPDGFTPIGRVISVGEHGVLVDGHPWSGAGGHDHFRS
jgi:thiamine-monophosphate kinase